MRTHPLLLPRRLTLFLLTLAMPCALFAEEKPEASVLKKEVMVVDYEKLKIKSFQYWDVYLHENQCYLGRVFIQLRDDRGIEDFMDIDDEVREEFFLIGGKVKKALKKLFNPDKMNYAALSNTSPVIHVHLVPRYKEPREWAGILFEDKRWGQNFAPYDRSFAIDETVLFKIRDALKDEL